MKRKYFALILISFMVGSTVVKQSFAATVQFNYTTNIRGPDLAGPPPWLTVTFDDGGVPGTVTETISIGGLTGSEKIRRLLFNLDPGLDPGELRFTYMPTSTAAAATRIRTGTNKFGDAESGKFDVIQKWRISEQLSPGQTLQYSISGIPGLTANSFAVNSATNCWWDHCTGLSPYRAAGVVTHESGGPWSSRSRTWIAPLDETSPTAVPVPGAVWLFGSGLVGLAGIARRRGQEIN
ncbi:MAG: hypothetical protein ACYDC8_10755 [Gammaproteobacteria bacterium]